MAREHFLVCDGCDAKISIPQADSNPPPAFVHAQITVGNWGKEVDLCASCHRKLMDTIDPEKWTRITPWEKAS